MDTPRLSTYRTRIRQVIQSAAGLPGKERHLLVGNSRALAATLWTLIGLVRGLV